MHLYGTRNDEGSIASFWRCQGYQTRMLSKNYYSIELKRASKTLYFYQWYFGTSFHVPWLSFHSLIYICYVVHFTCCVLRFVFQAQQMILSRFMLYDPYRRTERTRDELLLCLSRPPSVRSQHPPFLLIFWGSLCYNLIASCSSFVAVQQAMGTAHGQDAKWNTSQFHPEGCKSLGTRDKDPSSIRHPALPLPRAGAAKRRQPTLHTYMHPYCLRGITNKGVWDTHVHTHSPQRPCCYHSLPWDRPVHALCHLRSSPAG